jgi:hypothetical protein
MTGVVGNVLLSSAPTVQVENQNGHCVVGNASIVCLTMLAEFEHKICSLRERNLPIANLDTNVAVFVVVVILLLSEVIVQMALGKTGKLVCTTPPVIGKNYVKNVKLVDKVPSKQPAPG